MQLVYLGTETVTYKPLSLANYTDFKFSTSFKHYSGVSPTVILLSNLNTNFSGTAQSLGVSKWHHEAVLVPFPKNG